MGNIYLDLETYFVLFLADENIRNRYEITKKGVHRGSYVLSISPLFTNHLISPLRQQHSAPADPNVTQQSPIAHDQ